MIKILLKSIVLTFISVIPFAISYFILGLDFEEAAYLLPVVGLVVGSAVIISKFWIK